VSFELISIRPAVNFAWRALKSRCGLFAAILLTIFGAWVALEVMVIAGQRFGIVLWAAAHLGFLIFFAGLEVGLVRVCLTIHDGGEPTFADMFAHFALGPRFLAGQVLYLLILIVGMALLVVPGVYWGARYSLFAFSLVADETDLANSFRQSAILSAGLTARLLAIMLGLFAFNLLGASVLGLGLLVTVPLSLLTMTAVYRQLTRPLQDHSSPLNCAP